MKEILCLGYTLVLLPFFVGIIPMRLAGTKETGRNPGVQYLSGFFLVLALFQVFAVPAVLMKWDLSRLVLIYLALSCILLVTALVLMTKEYRIRKQTHLEDQSQPEAEHKKWKPGGNIELYCYQALFVGILLFQLYMAWTRASFDGDDAYYVAQSVMADQSGSMYEVDPYTGVQTPFDARHAMATITVWIAVLARVSGIHATIVAHSVLPMILIPITYLIYYQIGKNLFRKEEDGKRNISVSIFMIFMGLLQMFGYVSMYTKETFLLTRTWQGKSMVGNIAIPAILWILLEIYHKLVDTADEAKKNNRYEWCMLVILNIFAAMCTSLGVFLTAMLVGISGLIMAWNKKSFRLLVQLALCCTPCVVYMGLYMLLR